MEDLAERLYPEYTKARQRAYDLCAGDDRPTADEEQVAASILKEAIQVELTRQLGKKKPKKSEDWLAAEIQQSGDFPKAVAERAARDIRRKKLEEPPRGKVQ